jgi:hypothetical protein
MKVSYFLHAVLFPSISSGSMCLLLAADVTMGMKVHDLQLVVQAIMSLESYYILFFPHMPNGIVLNQLRIGTLPTYLPGIHTPMGNSNIFAQNYLFTIKLTAQDIVNSHLCFV